MSTISKGGGSHIGATKSSDVQPLSSLDELKALQKERACFQRNQVKQLKDQLEA